MSDIDLTKPVASGGAAPDKHLISEDSTIDDTFSYVVVHCLEIEQDVELEINDDGRLEVL